MSAARPEDPEAGVAELARRLAAAYPDSSTALHFSDPLQLLVATVLSAQCTDARVNAVTPTLFARCPRPADYAAMPLEELEAIIHPTGFYRQKARTLRALGQALAADHGGRVPASMEALVALPGVGRKTANVVLGNAFGMPGVVVDTHVRRVARRLGLSRADDPESVERDLMKLLPEAVWTAFSQRLILHGRALCKARRPRCDACTLAQLCPSAEP